MSSVAGNRCGTWIICARTRTKRTYPSEFGGSRSQGFLRHSEALTPGAQEFRVCHLGRLRGNEGRFVDRLGDGQAFDIGPGIPEGLLARGDLRIVVGRTAALPAASWRAGCLRRSPAAFPPVLASAAGRRSVAGPARTTAVEPRPRRVASQWSGCSTLSSTGMIPLGNQ